MDARSLKDRFGGLTELGRGGMGVVYRGFDPDLGREVAIKTVLDRGSSSRLERFQREGQISAALNHPGIVRVHSTGVADGLPYLVYELIPGVRSLEQVLPEVPLRRRLELIRDVSQALGYAHQRGVVHRDVKPENVLIDPSGAPRVADFGLASAAGLARLTQTGAILGTPHYMAPEQLGGAADAGPPADVWSLGVILYQALSGEVPFQGDSFLHVAAAIAEQDPPPLSAESPLRAICAKALEKEPGDRYPDASALGDELQAYLSGRAVSASHSQPWSRLARRARRPLRLLVPTALALGLLAYVYQAEPSPEPAAQQAGERTPEQAPSASPEAARPDPESVADGNRALAQISRLKDPLLRLASTRDWLRSHPGHPRRSAAEAYLEEHRLGFPLRLLRHQDEGRAWAEFLPDGRALTWSVEGAVALWDLDQEEPLRRWQVNGLRAVAVEGQGLVLLGARWLGHVARVGDDPQLEIVRVATSAVPTDGRTAAISPDGEQVFVGARDGSVVELSAANGEQVRSFTGLRPSGVAALAVSPDGTRLVGCDVRGPGGPTPLGGEPIRMRVWDLARGDELFATELGSSCLSLVFAPDSQSFLIGLSNGQVVAWSRDGLFLHRLDPPQGEQTPLADDTDYGVSGAHYQSVWGLAFSPDGTRLYTSSAWKPEPPPQGFHLRVWDATSRTCLRQVVLEGIHREPRRLLVSPDGRRLLAETLAGVVEVWAAE